MQTFGEQLTAARKAKGMTQDALAKAAAVTRQTISSWERGRTVPDIDTVRRLSEILGVDLIQTDAEQSAVTEAEGQTSPAATGKRPINKWWMIAGAAALVCVVLLVFRNYSVHLKKMQDAFVGTPFMASAGCPFAGNGRHKWRPYGVFPSYFRQD